MTGTGEGAGGTLSADDVDPGSADPTSLAPEPTAADQADTADEADAAGDLAPGR